MAHEYCCCAIPLLNFGIYLVLLEQFTVGIVAGTLSVATPTIVGAALPSFAPWILAVVCYVVAAIQVLGFLGVKKESTKVFRRYAMLNALTVSLAFGVAATFVGVSWARHSTAVKNCITDFFQNLTGGSSSDTQSQTLCKIFAFVNEGVMTGLLILLAIVQFCFVLVTRFYGQAQREDHKRYFSVYGEGGPDDILLDERPAGDTWDARSPPHATSQGGQYQHVRTTSNTSTIMDEPYQQPNAAPYEHLPPTTEPGNPRYSDEYDEYDSHATPTAEQPSNSHPPGGYEHNQHFPESHPTTSYATPTIPADQPRYQLYDSKE